MSDCLPHTMTSLVYCFFHVLFLFHVEVGASCKKPVGDWVPDEMECSSENTRWIQPGEEVPTGTPMRARRTLPPGFIIANSTIPGAGLGVFSTMFIPRYTWLAEYEGEIILNECHISDSAWNIYRGDRFYFHVDARKEETSNWLRYINCSRKESEENVFMIQCFSKPYYVTRKDIVPGDELYVYYGPNEAEDMGVDVQNYASN